MIQTANLTRHFGSLAAVQDLNLTVNRGELYGFLGPNGAGKTTTIRMLIGLLRPTSGNAVVAGHDVQQEPLAVKRATGYLAQTPLLYNKLLAPLCPSPASPSTLRSLADLGPLAPGDFRVVYDQYRLEPPGDGRVVWLRPAVARLRPRRLRRGAARRVR